MNQALNRVRVWDLPTRLFHLLLLLSFAGLIISGQIGGDDVMQLHFYCGYLILSLLFFRLIWGVIGGYWSRFANFVPTPRSLWGYGMALRNNQDPRFVSHNPLGALSVLAMLLLLLVQVLSGLMADDEVSVQGPWTACVPNSWVEWATYYHTEIGQVVLLCLVGLHVATVLYRRAFKNDDLISPMTHGDKTLPSATRPTQDTWRTRLLALVVWAACAYAVFYLVKLLPT